MRFTPHQYQLEAIRFMLSRPYAALFADPGLGKTVTALTVIRILQFLLNKPVRTLVVAPPRPLKSTWPAEIEQWDHTRGMSYQLFGGDEKVIDREKDIILVSSNHRTLRNALEQRNARKLNVLVVDESSQFKTWMASRSKILRKRLKQFDFRYILTGTPAPNGLLDLFSQIFICDLGRTFGKSSVMYKKRYFYSTDYFERNWEPHEGSEEKRLSLLWGSTSKNRVCETHKLLRDSR